jgi:hypothetical protein
MRPTAWTAAAIVQYLADLAPSDARDLRCCIVFGTMNSLPRGRLVFAARCFELDSFATFVAIAAFYCVAVPVEHDVRNYRAVNRDLPAYVSHGEHRHGNHSHRRRRDILVWRLRLLRTGTLVLALVGCSTPALNNLHDHRTAPPRCPPARACL